MKNNKTKLFAFLLAASSSLTGCDEIKPDRPAGLYLVEFEGIHIDTPDQYYGYAKFLDKDSIKYKEAQQFKIDEETYKKFKLYYNEKKVLLAPNRVAIIHIDSSKSGKAVDSIYSAKCVDPKMKKYWQRRVEEAKNDPTIIFQKE